MDVSSQPPNRMRWITGRNSRRTRWLVFFSGLFVLLLGLTFQVFAFPQSNVAYSAPLSHTDANPANPAHSADTSPTASGPPTLSLAVPSSGQGPVGAHLTIIGSNWGATDVLVGAAAPGLSCSDPNNWTQTFNHVRPQADQSIVFTFYWPNSLTATGGAYSICASNSVGAASVSYQLLSLSSPTLTLSPTTTTAGSLVSITGQNFVGSGSVTLSVTDGQGKTRDLTTLSPNESGGISLTYQPRPTDVGDVVLHAFTSAPQGMQPAIQVSAKLHVDAAATPTVAATPTPAGPLAPNSPGGNGDSSTMLIVALVAVGLLALVAVAGAIFFFMMRKRNNPGEDVNYGSPYFGGSGPGYDRQGNSFGGGMGGVGNMDDTASWDAPAQSGYGAYDQGGYPPQAGYGTGAGGWPASDEPDPNWRPRPMTGQWRAPDEYGDSPYGNYGPNESGQYPPQDPWGSPDASYGQPGQPSRGGYGGSYPPPDPRSRRPGSGPGGSPGRGAGGGTPDTSRGRYPEPPADDDW